MKDVDLTELLLQALETELGGVEVYTTAIRCAVNEELREEWEHYLEQTTNHVDVVRELCTTFEIDPEQESPGRSIVKQMGQSLLALMNAALKDGDKNAAQLVAAECVVTAETKDHQNWELLGIAAKQLKGERGRALREAHEQIEEQEDEHLYHTQGWSRELWIEALGMKAVLPPPEEERHVKTAIGAARAKQSREEML